MVCRVCSRLEPPRAGAGRPRAPQIEMKLHNSHAPTGYGFYDSVGSAAPFRRTPNEPHLASIHNIFSLNEAKLLRHCCLHLNVAVDVNGDCEMVAGNSALE